MNIKNKSKLMIFAEYLGFERFAWSLRRLYCPVTSDALVLDVGSGGNPYPRANVLLDAYEESIERYSLPLIKDRPLVFGLAEKMPFKDKAFDFVVASHVLEHTPDPDKFISELMRVGKSGYIETPDGFFERINPFRFHRLEVFEKKDKLLIFKKSNWKPFSELVEMYENKMKDKKFIKFLSDHPSPFYVRYYWDEKIKYEILNPEVNANWPMPAVEFNSYTDKHGNIRLFLLKIIRLIFSQNNRNKKIAIIDLLKCPSCDSEDLVENNQKILCNSCDAIYQYKNNIPTMYPR